MQCLSSTCVSQLYVEKKDAAMSSIKSLKNFALSFVQDSKQRNLHNLKITRLVLCTGLKYNTIVY